MVTHTTLWMSLCCAALQLNPGRQRLRARGFDERWDIVLERRSHRLWNVRTPTGPSPAGIGPATTVLVAVAIADMLSPAPSVLYFLDSRGLGA